MSLPFMKKFQKSVEKLENVTTDFSPPKHWYHTGNYALNRIMSGSLLKGVPESRVITLAGPSGCIPANEIITVYRCQAPENQLHTPVSQEGNDEQSQEVKDVRSNLASFIKKVYETEVAFLKNQIGQGFDAHAHIDGTAVPTAIIDVIDSCKSSDPALYLVNTPDGWLPIFEFFEKKERNCLSIMTTNNSILCSTDHLLKKDVDENTGEWRYAREVVVGDYISTQDGYEQVIKIDDFGTLPVYDFQVAHPEQRYWAGTGVESHNSGKSFLLGNILREAQKEGAFIVVLDSENALDKVFLENIGVDTSPEKLFYAGVVTIGDTVSVVSEFITSYIKEYGQDNPDAPKIVMCLDSLDMLLTDSENDKFDSGRQTGDQGQKAKNLKHLLKTVVNKIARTRITFINTHQVYLNQDMLNGEGKYIVNNAVKYAASQIFLITKLKLKEGQEVNGIRMRVETYKSRFAKLGSKVEIEVPYETGMNPFSGLLEPLKDEGIITQSGAWYSYIDQETGEEKKFQRKNFDHDLFHEILKHPKLRSAEEQATLIIEGTGDVDIDTPKEEGDVIEHDTD